MASELIPVGNLGQSKLLEDATTFVAEVVVAKIRAGESITVGAMPASTTVGGTITANQGTAGAAAWLAKLPATWYITGASALNAALTLTKAAAVGQRHYITGFTVSLWGAPAAQEIEAALNDGVIKAFSAIIGEGASTGERLTEQFSHPIQMGVNTAVTLVIDAGGAGVGTIANLLGYTQ